MKTKAEDIYNHPDITSKDRDAKIKVRDTQKDILLSLDTMDKTMVKLVKAKDVAYEKIRDMKKQLQDINKNRFLRKKMEEHDIKLNTRGTISRKPWVLQSDTVKYPIL